MMTKFSTGMMKKAFATASFLALLMPGLAQAATHLISIVNPTTSINGTMVVTGTGDGPFPVTGLKLNISDSDVEFSGNLTLIRTNVSICSGSEWIDQGNASVGVHGSLTGTTGTSPNITTYTLTFPVTTATSTGTSIPCSAGSTNYTITRGVSLSDGTTTSNSTYNYWNDPASAPEPGTLFLTLMGLLGLVWFSKNRLRNA